jgi:hypothetical protein
VHIEVSMHPLHRGVGGGGGAGKRNLVTTNLSAFAMTKASKAHFV